MDCAKARKMLLENISVPDDELRRHCSVCPSCSAEAAMLEAENTAISNMPEASPSSGLCLTVSRELEKERATAHDLRDSVTALLLLAVPLIAALYGRMFYPSNFAALLAPLPETWQQYLLDLTSGLGNGQISILQLYMALPGPLRFSAILLGTATAMSVGLFPIQGNSRRTI